MEETSAQHLLHKMFRFALYLWVAIDCLYFYFWPLQSAGFKGLNDLLDRLHLVFSRLWILDSPVHSRLFLIVLLCLSSVGTVAKKEVQMDTLRSISLPMICGVGLMSLNVFLYYFCSGKLIPHAYALSLFCATLMINIAADNLSKILHSTFGSDRWNIEQESFEQPTTPLSGPYAVSLPSLFYFKGKLRKGFVNIGNIFRGTLLIGTPGSGKSYGVVMPVIRQLLAKGFSMCLYDFKYPDLAQLGYYHYLKGVASGVLRNHSFHVVNLNNIEQSQRVNVLKKEYIITLADAAETAEALVEALKKGEKSGGSDQFFTQSAVNFLAACIYFFSRYQSGRYSSLPHVLSFLNCSYEQIFSTLVTNSELSSLLSPFMSAFRARAFDQLEGQVGTLKIFISRLATLETYWVFSGNDFNLKLSDPLDPSILILANDPNTQNINSACYSIVLNRLTRLLNSKGNLPSAIILDELPTIYVHRIENLIATARSNKVAVLMGLQELPQFQQQYGKDVSATICAVVGNVLSGSVRNKETLDWLEKLFGKVKQTSQSLSIDRGKTSVSLSERMEALIPAGKIASLATGEIVGMLAADHPVSSEGKYLTSAVKCRINLNQKTIQAEESSYIDMPVYYDFKGRKDQVLSENFVAINLQVSQIVADCTG
ncbi:type IV secretion system DNA-binding domain-containing protein [Pedobacter sp. AW1-32]|uniref:type IV secretion system DNA-binding domain-containing protein n=1 Tax=Pedobacter sp. AW1-32 TaxID=3383026 RepID=UPI003FEE4A55